eukprot:g1942.t1
MDSERMTQERERESAEFYEREYGLRPVINAMGSMTSLGGSKMRPECAEAMRCASSAFIDLNALLLRAGHRAARVARAPEGYDAHICTGAAAATALAVAACLTGDDAAKIAALPDTAQFARRRVLLDGASDTRWIRNVQLTGARAELVAGSSGTGHMDEAALRAELARGDVAAVVLFAVGDDEGALPGSGPPLRAVLRAAHAQRPPVPVILDAAAQLPPASNLWKYTGLGVDVVIFSGGKHVGGPQTSGLLLGRAPLVQAARLNGSPNETTIGRAMKCSKESICGFVAALEAFVREEEEGVGVGVGVGVGGGGTFRRCEEVCAALALRLRGVPGVAACRRVVGGSPDIQPNCLPWLYIDLAAAPVGGDPRIGKRSDKRGGDQGAGQGKAAGLAGFYGDSVDHGNPLAVVAVDAPTTLASLLARGSEAEPQIGVNTTAQGVMVNPQTLSGAREVGAVAERIERAVRQMVTDGVIVGTTAGQPSKSKL